MEAVYLASRYSRHDEMQGVRDVLEVFGIKITSRWIDLHRDAHTGSLDRSFQVETLNTNPEFCEPYAVTDFDDVVAADTVISFTCGTGGKGGRHVEFGIGLGLGKRMIVVGPREHVFHTMPSVEWFPDWPRLVMAITKERGLPTGRAGLSNTQGDGSDRQKGT